MTQTKNDLSPEYVRARFVYEEDTGYLYWKHCPEMPPQWNGKWAGIRAGNLSDQGYWNVYLSGRNYKAHRLIWVILYGEWPLHDIDHVDGDRSNNRPENLRAATRCENLANMKTRRNGLKGVTRGASAWFARIRKDGVVHHLGSFGTEQEAHEAYCTAATRLNGRFARTEV